MSVELRKQIVDLSKKAAFQANRHGVEDLRAQVVLVLDISLSMNRLYKDGTVQKVIERILAMALTFDDDGEVDLFLFGTHAYQLPPVNLDGIAGYVERVILKDYKIVEATKYAPPLRLIHEKYRKPQPDPVFVIFITDGGNSDRRETTEVVQAMSGEPIFIQFVGIGAEKFPFLQRLDELTGRVVDNAGFMQVNDITLMKDSELFDRLLNEFPQWLPAARAAGILG